MIKKLYKARRKLIVATEMKRAKKLMKNNWLNFSAKQSRVKYYEIKLKKLKIKRVRELYDIRNTNN